ncbi:hypothetical protein [Desulfosarcina variabilis]|uniref:hypothetical protein n=1 Tax=Desulfosarcina variabilis TaxID=2300 RepID=UPI003AFB0421
MMAVGTGVFFITEQIDSLKGEQILLKGEQIESFERKFEEEEKKCQKAQEEKRHLSKDVREQQVKLEQAQKDAQDLKTQLGMVNSKWKEKYKDEKAALEAEKERFEALKKQYVNLGDIHRNTKMEIERLNNELDRVKRLCPDDQIKIVQIVFTRVNKTLAQNVSESLQEAGFATMTTPYDNWVKSVRDYFRDANVPHLPETAIYVSDRNTPGLAEIKKTVTALLGVKHIETPHFTAEVATGFGIEEREALVLLR